MKRTLASLDERVWEAAALQRCHASAIEAAYSVSDLRALFAAHGRLKGVKPSEYEPDEDTVAKMRSLKASFAGVRA